MAPLLLQGKVAAIPATVLIPIFAGISSAAGDGARLCSCWRLGCVPAAADILHAIIVSVFAGTAPILAVAVVSALSLLQLIFFML